MAPQCRELADQAEAIELRRRKHVAGKNRVRKTFFWNHRALEENREGFLNSHIAKI